MEYSKNFFKILIRDDGIGIDEGVLKIGARRALGTFGMKERRKNRREAESLQPNRSRNGNRINCSEPRRF
jgi:hypothetical protein